MERQLGDVARIRTGRTPTDPFRRKIYSSQGVPFARVRDVTRSNGLLTTTEFKLTDGAESESVDAEKNSVMVSISGTIGAVAVLGIDTYFNQAMVNIDQYHNLLPDYLMFQLMAKKLEFLSHAYGTCQLNLRQEVIKKTKIKVASLDEQKEIIKTLTDVNTLIRLQKQNVAKLEAMMTALLQSTFKR